jgi:hypothetical protein
MNYEIVYLGHDNSIDLLLKSNGTAVSLATVNRMSLTLNDKAVDSTNSTAQPIQWNKNNYVTGEVRISLGTESTLTPGDYDATLIVYDSTYTNGIVWGAIPLRIKSNMEGSTTT